MQPPDEEMTAKETQVLSLEGGLVTGIGGQSSSKRFLFEG